MMRAVALNPLLLVATVLLCLHSVVAQSSIPTGSVVDKVVVQASPDQSYAAYLPRSYTPEKQWPTIFCLDPRARGKTAIGRFVLAAEKYGYIVVCSNNSRNGLNWTTISSIFSSFWQDVHMRFNVDTQRTYAAGFSGGSRLAAVFASRCRGCLAGVIACGAGFPNDIKPDSSTTFAYFGVAGVDDFNFSEMWELDKKFSELRVSYHFETFDGRHEWAPAGNIDNALAWLNLLAMKSGTLTKDEKFLDEQFATRLSYADQQRTTGKLIEGSKSYLSITRDFQGVRDVTRVAESATQLKKSSEFRKQEKAEEELLRRQLQEAGEIRMLWMKAPNPDESRSTRYEAGVRLKDWQKKKDSPSDSSDRRLARRILSQLLIGAIETAQPDLVPGSEFNAALTNYQFAKAIDPKNANIAFEVARILALKRQKKAALEALEEAVSLGFKDLSRIKNEAAFETFTTEPRFQKLLASLNTQ
jgi:tetratricopeptide (TPR) repeat protein